jgi:signal transduction histidine kinase
MRKQICKYSIALLCMLQFLFTTNAREETATLPSQEVMLQLPYDSLLSLANKYSISQLSHSLVYIDFAIEKGQQSGEFKKHFDAIRLKGMIYEDNQDYKNAVAQYLLAEQVAIQFSDEERNAIYTDLAIAYRKDGQYQLAKEYHNKVLNFAIQMNDLQAIENSYDGLGTLFSLADDLDNAIKHYLKSLEYAEMRNNREGIIITLKNISDCYSRMKDSQQALSTIQKAYDMARDEKGVQSLLIDILSKYGAILGENGDFEAAYAKLDEGLKLCRNKINYSKLKYKLLIIKGDLLMLQNKTEEAKVIYSECLNNENYLDNYLICKINYELGNLYFQKKTNKLAIRYLNKSLQISKEHEFLILAEKSHQTLYHIYKSEKQYEKAIFHIESANTLRDLIFNQEKVKRAAELQFRYQLEKSDKEIQSLKLRENKFLLYSSISIFALLIGFLAYILSLRGQNYKTLKVKTKEIEEKNKKLEETNQVLHQFAYASAHDLKEPLRTIGSFISLIQRRYGKDLPAEANEYMAYVTGGVQKMNHLLEDLLQYSTLTMNGKEIIREQVKLDEIVREITQNLQSAIQNKEATIIFPDNMPFVFMSRLHATQLLQNLISNALKFVEKQPLIKVETQENDANVLVTIEDNGIGIKKEYSDKIFKLFQRLHKNDKRFEGTGLGLAICKNIVDKYNGEIWFESVENQGTKFFINLPKVAA